MKCKQRRIVGRAAAHMEKCRGRRAGRAGVVVGTLLALLVLSGCGNTFSRMQLQEASCVRTRLNAAEISYEDAKSQFADHFKSRAETSLRFAYMASLDSSRLALSIRRCFDFDRSDIYEARNIMQSNRIFRRLVKSNLRDSDPQQAVGIFGDQYREIFKNDID